MAKPSKLISLSLYPAEIELLDALVALAAKASFTPKKVNRSTVIRDLVVQAMREKRKLEEEVMNGSHNRGGD